MTSLNMDLLYGLPHQERRRMTERITPILDRFDGFVTPRDGRLTLTESQRLIARLVAHALDPRVMPEGRHSRAL